MPKKYYNWGMGKLPKPTDQFPELVTEKLKMAAVTMADKIDERERKRVYLTYESKDLHDMYRAMRKRNDLDIKKGMTDNKSMRHVISIPNMSVYKFLESYFQPWYGDDWLSNRKLWKHEFIKPWLVVSNP